MNNTIWWSVATLVLIPTMNRICTNYSFVKLIQEDLILHKIWEPNIITKMMDDLFKAT